MHTRVLSRSIGPYKLAYWLRKHGYLARKHGYDSQVIDWVNYFSYEQLCCLFDHFLSKDTLVIANSLLVRWQS